jgi:phage shock protein PspC (stress-responsive transcriptional regulator)
MKNSYFSHFHDSSVTSIKSKIVRVLRAVIVFFIYFTGILVIRYLVTSGWIFSAQ